MNKKKVLKVRLIMEVDDKCLSEARACWKSYGAAQKKKDDNNNNNNSNNDNSSNDYNNNNNNDNNNKKGMMVTNKQGIYMLGSYNWSVGEK